MFLLVREILPLTNMVESGGGLADLCLRNQNHCRAWRPVEFKRPGGQTGLPGDRFLFFTERHSPGNCPDNWGNVRNFRSGDPRPHGRTGGPGYRPAEGLSSEPGGGPGGRQSHGHGQGHGVFCGEQIPLAAIPTTSGSGAEVTDFAIVTHNEVKHPLVSERLRPQSVSYTHLTLPTKLEV